MRNVSLLPTIAALVLMLTGCTGAGDNVALRYDGEKVTLAEFEDEFRLKGPKDFDAADRDSVLLAFADGFLDKLVMAREAVRNPRGDSHQLARLVGDGVRKKVIEVYKSRLFEELDLSPEKLDKVFGYLGEQVRVRHVLCDTREEAQEVHDLLAGGADFLELVKTRSRDAFSVPQGGELEWFGYGDYAGLDDAAFELEIGEISEPVWTRRGWHIIRLEERRPRQRTVVDAKRNLFDAHYQDKLKRQRWAEFLDILWREYKPTWDEEGYDLAAALQTDYVDRYLVMARQAKAIRDTGGVLDKSFFEFPKGPEPTSEQGPVVVVRGEKGFEYTVADAADDMWLTPFTDRPDPAATGAYRSWLEIQIRERLAVFNARLEMPASDPEMARTISDAEEFAYVNALFSEEIESKVRPTQEDVNAFYEAHKEYYKWRADLDLAVFRTSDKAVAEQIVSALENGEEIAEIQNRFQSDPTLEVTPRTGLKRRFEELKGLTELARGLSDSVGQVAGPNLLEDKFTALRIEEVGEQQPMTAEEAYQYVMPHCMADMREKHTRALLDSLRKEMKASYNKDVVLRSNIAAPEKDA